MSNGYHQDEKLFSDLDLEDEFVTWTHLFTYDNGAGNNLGRCLIDNEGYTIINDLTGNNILTFDRYANMTVLAGQQFNWQNDYAISHTHKYLADGVTPVPLPLLVIFRHGTRIWTRNPQLDEGQVRRILYLDLSPNGRFLAIVCDRLVTLIDRYLLVYEGS